jgi:hypothetical protein
MASQREIAKETNARFWITTSYKPGVSLDPNDPADKQMARLWMDIYKDLVRQNMHGALSLTYKHEGLARRLNDAIEAYRIESRVPQGSPRWVDARRAKHEALNDAGLWRTMLENRHIA